MKLLIKKYRLQKRITLRTLSNYTGYSRSYLSLIENHKKSPRLVTIRKIGYALEICREPHMTKVTCFIPCVITLCYP